METNETRDTQGGAIRGWAFFLMVVFFGTLVAVLIVRARMEGGALVLGVVCGVGASIPASLLAIFLGRNSEPAEVGSPEPQQPYPPLVILNGPPPTPRPPLPDFPPLNQPSAPATAAPRYRVIGDE